MEKRKYGEIPRLEDFNASPTFGFVEPNPAEDLPEYFKPWVDLARQRTELIESGEMRNRINQLPLLDHNRLGNPSEWRAALMFLTALTYAYVWCEGEDGIPEVLPRCVAVPYAAVAEKIQITPSFTSYAYGLNNWRRKDPKGKVELDNIETILSGPAGEDESWFLCVATQVELHFAPALCSILAAQQAVIDEDAEKVTSELQTIEGAIVNMKNSLNRIYERCRPYVFYNILRPYLAGWDSPAFKKKNLKGLIYEGVSDEPLQFTGGSAAQSSTMQCLDAALDVAHSQSVDKLCKLFRQYMPKPHSDLIDAIAQGPSIKSFVHECGSSAAVEAFDGCLLAMKSFRDSHLQIAARYIVGPSREANANKKYSSQAAAGTGGTGFMVFLKGLRDATIHTMLGKDRNDNLTKTSEHAAGNGSILPSNHQHVSAHNWKRYLGPVTVSVAAAALTVMATRKW